MWNFNIPYRLKQYIDVIAQPGLTFKVEAGKGYVGLVTGKPLMLVLARGGSYGPGDPTQSYDFQETYLRGIFGFIGFTDIRSVRIQGTLEHPREQVEADTQKAIAEAVAAVATFAGVAPVGAGKKT
jgi:FMN-dependent NADH-azoreductase